MTDREPLTPDDGVDVGEWYEDLTYREAHLAMEGGFDGFRQVKPRFGKQVQGKVAADSWYYKGGYVLGWTLKALLLIGLAYAGASVGVEMGVLRFLPSVPVSV